MDMKRVDPRVVPYALQVALNYGGGTAAQLFFPIGVDSYSNLTSRLVVYAMTAGTADGLTGDAPGNDGVALAGLLALDARAFLMGKNAAGNGDSIRALADNADAQAPAGLGALLTLARQQVFDGATYQRRREAFVQATAFVTAAGSTVIYTAPAGAYWRLLGYSLELTQNANQAVAGALHAQFYDAATALAIAHSWYVPAAAVAGQGSDPITPMALGQGYRSAATGTSLNLNLSAALAGGSGIRVNVALAVGASA